MKTYKLSCPDGFMVKSHKKGEVIDFGREHLKKEHDEDMTRYEIGKKVKAM